MQYKKLTSGSTVIEFHNSWLGVETVYANGKEVAKGSSILGMNHYFSVMEDGHDVRYILTTKVDANLQVLIDLSRNGEVLHSNVPVPYGNKPRKPQNKAKKKGLQFLKQYDLDDALNELQIALDLDPDDPEIYFHMACAYSVQERTEEGFSALAAAVQKGLTDTEEILKHDMLAFIRMHPAFEGFVNSGFSEYHDETRRDENTHLTGN